MRQRLHDRGVIEWASLVGFVYLHDPDDHWRPPPEEAMPALAELHDQGVIGAMGAGRNQSALLARFSRPGEAHGTTLPVAAIAFPRTHPSIINVTLGMRTPEQVVRNVKLQDQRVPDGLWPDLRAQGPIRSDVLAGHAGGRDARCL